MNPFYVLGVSADATDEQIEQRYHELIRSFTPEKAPEQFATIRRAFEAIRDPRARAQTLLFHLDDATAELGPPPRPAAPRPRVSAEELAALLASIATAEDLP